MAHIRTRMDASGTVTSTQLYPVLDAGNVVVDLLDLDGADWQSHDPGAGLTMGDPEHDTIRIGNTWDGSDYVAPGPTKDRLKAYAADLRWNAETGGIVVTGMDIPTDDRAKLLLQGAAAGIADEDTAEFVTLAGSVTLTGAQFKAIYAAVFAHVQACFAVQSGIIADIDSETITTFAEIDAVAWP